MHHLNTVGLHDDFVIEEQVWVDLVHRWEHDTLTVMSVHTNGGQSSDEHSLVHVETTPTSSLVEGHKVFAGVQESEHNAKFFTMLLTEYREEGITFEHTKTESVQEFSDDHLER